MTQALALTAADSVRGLALLADAAIKGLVVLGAAAAITAALRRSSAALRHLVWTLAVAALALIPVLSAALPAWRVPVLPESAPAEVRSLAGAPATVYSPGAEDAAVRPPAYSPSADGTAVRPPDVPACRQAGSPGANDGVRPPVRGADDAPAPPAAPMHWSAWILLAWAAGTVLMMAILLTGTVAVWRARRQARLVTDRRWLALLVDLSASLGVRRPVTLMQSPGSLIPMTCGILRPMILLPAEAEEWAEERRSVVLLHELAHIKRADCLTQAAARLVRAVYWFNPLAWLAGRMLRIERERACDDRVLAAGHKASAYASHLLEIVSTLRSVRCPSLAAVAMARRSQFEGRMLAILDPRRSRRRLTRLGLAAAALLVVGVVLPLSMFRATAANKAEKSEKPVAAVTDSAAAGVAGAGVKTALPGSTITDIARYFPAYDDFAIVAEAAEAPQAEELEGGWHSVARQEFKVIEPLKKWLDAKTMSVTYNFRVPAEGPIAKGRRVIWVGQYGEGAKAFEDTPETRRAVSDIIALSTADAKTELLPQLQIGQRNMLLPGSSMALADALHRRSHMIILAQAGVDMNGGVCEGLAEYVGQKYKVLQSLAGGAAGDEAVINYVVGEVRETNIDKEQKVLWIVEPGLGMPYGPDSGEPARQPLLWWSVGWESTMGAADNLPYWIGLKALRDTPENRRLLGVAEKGPAPAAAPKFPAHVVTWSPEESARQLGDWKGKAVDAGFAFVEGRYVEAPYTVSRRGAAIFINGVPLTDGRWTPPTGYDPEDKKPAPPAGLGRDTTFDDLYLPDTWNDSWDRRMVRWLFRQSGANYTRDEKFLQSVLEFYKGLPFIKEARWNPDYRPGILLETVRGEPVTINVDFYLGAEPTKADMAARLDSECRQLEAAMAQGDCLFLYGQGHRFTLNKTRAAADLGLATEVLSSGRTAAEKQDLLTRLLLEDGAYGAEAVTSLIKGFRPSKELQDRVARLVQATGVKPRTLSDLPAKPGGVSPTVPAAADRAKKSAAAVTDSAAGLSPELLKKRDQLLAEADQKLRQGLRDLAQTFPQLCTANNKPLEDAMKNYPSGPAGHLSVFFGRGNTMTLTPWQPEAIADAQTWSLLAFIRVGNGVGAGGTVAQLGVGEFCPHLNLFGQWHAKAGDPKLQAALQKLLDDALAPLLALDREAAGEKPPTVALKADGINWDLYGHENMADLRPDGPLPGSGLALEEAMKTPNRVIAACEATEDVGALLSGSQGYAAQKFKVIERFDGATERGQEVQVRYTVASSLRITERLPKKGEQVLWIATVEPGDPKLKIVQWHGLKAVAYTPVNLKAIGLPPAVPAAVAKPAALTEAQKAEIEKELAAVFAQAVKDHDEAARQLADLKPGETVVESSLAGPRDEPKLKDFMPWGLWIGSATSGSLSLNRSKDMEALCRGLSESDSAARRRACVEIAARGLSNKDPKYVAVACELLSHLPVEAVEAGLAPALAALLDDRRVAFEGVLINIGQRDTFARKVDGGVTVSALAAATLAHMTTFHFDSPKTFQAWWDRNKDYRARLWYWSLRWRDVRPDNEQPALADLPGLAPADALRLMLLAASSEATLADAGVPWSAGLGRSDTGPILAWEHYRPQFSPKTVADFIRRSGLKNILLAVVRQDPPWPEAKDPRILSDLFEGGSGSATALLPILPLALDKADAGELAKEVEAPHGVLANDQLLADLVKIVVALDPDRTEGLLVSALKRKAAQPLIATQLVRCSGLKHWDLIQAACPPGMARRDVIPVLGELKTKEAAAILLKWIGEEDWTTKLNNLGYDPDPQKEYLVEAFVKAAVAMNDGKPVISKDLFDRARWHPSKGMTGGEMKEAYKDVPAAQAEIVAALKEFFAGVAAPAAAPPKDAAVQALCAWADVIGVAELRSGEAMARPALDFKGDRVLKGPIDLDTERHEWFSLLGGRPYADLPKPAAGRTGKWIVFLRLYADGTAVPAVEAMAKEGWYLEDTPELEQQVVRTIPLPAEWSPVADGIEMGLRPRSDKVGPGEDVVVEVCLRNAGKEPKAVGQLRYNIYDYYHGLTFAVQDDAGGQWTLAKPEKYFTESDRPLTRTLAPGEVYVHPIYLSKWPARDKAGKAKPVFDHAGAYTIRCQLDQGRGGQLDAPPVTVTVAAARGDEAAPGASGATGGLSKRSGDPYGPAGAPAKVAADGPALVVKAIQRIHDRVAALREKYPVLEGIDAASEIGDNHDPTGENRNWGFWNNATMTAQIAGPKAIDRSKPFCLITLSIMTVDRAGRMEGGQRYRIGGKTWVALPQVATDVAGLGDAVMAIMVEEFAAAEKPAAPGAAKPAGSSTEALAAPPAAVEEPPWGEADHGVRLALRPEKPTWAPGETIRFRADLANRGPQALNTLVCQGVPVWDVEVDGKWYVWGGASKTLFDLEPAAEYRNFPIVLTGPEASWTLKGATNQGLILPPGRHTLRVAAPCTEFKEPFGHKDAARPVSQPLEFDVPAVADTEAARDEAYYRRLYEWYRGRILPALGTDVQREKNDVARRTAQFNDEIGGGLLFVRVTHIGFLDKMEVLINQAFGDRHVALPNIKYRETGAPHVTRVTNPGGDYFLMETQHLTADTYPDNVYVTLAVRADLRQTLLPGLIYTLDLALRSGSPIVAACEALEDSGDEFAVGQHAVAQRFKVAAILVPQKGPADVKEAVIQYTSAAGVYRRIAKGDKVIWYGRPAASGPGDSPAHWEGLMVLPDTPENRQAAVQTAELAKKRAELLAEADKKLKQDLRDLVKTFPQLATANNRPLDEALNRDPSPAGSLSIEIGRSNKEAKTTWRPEPITDAETWSLVAYLEPASGGMSDLLAGGALASATFGGPFGFNLSLEGSWQIEAGDPKLKIALRKLLDDAMEPLHALDRELAARQPAGNAPATPKEMEGLLSAVYMALGQDWQIDARPGFWGSGKEPGVFLQGHNQSLRFKGPEGQELSAAFTLYLHPLWAGKEPEGVHLPGGGLEKVIAESKTYRVYGSMVLPPDVDRKTLEEAILRILAAWPPYAGQPGPAATP